MLNTLQRADRYYELTQFPQLNSMFFDVIRSSFKKPSSSSVALHLGAQIHDVRFDQAWVQAYQAVCGFEASKTIPLTAPQVLAGPLHLYLFSRKAHPFPIFGMVHVRNEFELFVDLDYEQVYTIFVLIGETRSVAKGCEFDVITEFYANDELAWRSTMTVLSRVKGMTSPPIAANQELVQMHRFNEASYLEVKVPAKQGLDYAKISGDYNPIHLHLLSARPFGFRQPIAHGMWSAAACLAKLEKQMHQTARYFEVSFKKPVFLRSHSVLKYESLDSNTQFELMSSKGSAVQVTGSVTFFKKTLNAS